MAHEHYKQGESAFAKNRSGKASNPYGSSGQEAYDWARGHESAERDYHSDDIDDDTWHTYSPKAPAASKSMKTNWYGGNTGGSTGHSHNANHPHA